MCGDESLIWIKNGKGGVIDFNIVVPTEKGAIYACKFICTSEIAASSTKCSIKMNINMAHCVLGHCNDDSVSSKGTWMGVDAQYIETMQKLC